MQAKRAKPIWLRRPEEFELTIEELQRYAEYRLQFHQLLRAHGLIAPPPMPELPEKHGDNRPAKKALRYKALRRVATALRDDAMIVGPDGSRLKPQWYKAVRTFMYDQARLWAAGRAYWSRERIWELPLTHLLFIRAMQRFQEEASAARTPSDVIPGHSDEARRDRAQKRRAELWPPKSDPRLDEGVFWTNVEFGPPGEDIYDILVKTTNCGPREAALAYAAKCLGITPRTVRNWLRTGPRLPAANREP